MTHSSRATRHLITVGLPLMALALVLGSRARFVEAAEESTTEDSLEIVPISKVEWTPLNPARGDASPQAGTLWGDRAASPQTGFLVKFADGFSSPPHIHNVTYRGVVISGEIHNDDPEAQAMWMPTGSFWTQPAGEVHITSAQGASNMAFIEIESGPYLVWPPEQATDNGERPVNVHPSNLVWLNETNTSWITAEGPEIAFVWGQPRNGKSNGTLLRLPAGFAGELIVEAAELKAVVIKGNVGLQPGGKTESNTLAPGSYFRSEGGASHVIRAHEGASTLYLRSEGTFKVNEASIAQ
ncbi:MAG: DUF4437 domain-containing protein [Verrucomicrobiota bacterium]